MKNVLLLTTSLTIPLLIISTRQVSSFITVIAYTTKNTPTSLLSRRVIHPGAVLRKFVPPNYRPSFNSPLNTGIAGDGAVRFGLSKRYADNRGENSSGEETITENNDLSPQDNFDGKGFAGYLAPYILALFASIAATAGFVKFVLMDY
mmetsp:Transcript_38147/g.46536  ORF Transcript_38147/g.46536 Transcript_38147/m.46536 type:complete len:148 (+) Transcript_38147:73-516(+)